MKNQKNIFNRFRPNIRYLIWSLISGIALLLVCYFVDNLPYSFLSGPTIGQRVEQIKEYFKTTDDNIPEDLLFVNVAYDRQLVDVYDEFGFRKGNIDITDRQKLLQLLRKLQKSNYKYIVLDIAFPNDYKSDEDSLLFALINRMENIVVAKSERITLADVSLSAKARYSDYSTHIAETNFVKYDFIRKGEASLPYQMYIDLFGNKIQSFGPFYFFNGKLANKSVVLRHPVKLWNKFANFESKERAESQFYDLGADLLELDMDVSKMADNKIVVIGDFTENDIHDTYLGKISGPVINVNGFYALKNDNLSLPYWYILFLIGLYTITTYCIIAKIDILKHFTLFQKIKFVTVRYIISTLGLTTLFTVVAILVYWIFSLECNVLIPSIYFSFLLGLIKYRSFKRTNYSKL